MTLVVEAGADDALGGFEHERAELVHDLGAGAVAFLIDLGLGARDEAIVLLDAALAPFFSELLGDLVRLVDDLPGFLAGALEQLTRRLAASSSASRLASSAA